MSEKNSVDHFLEHINSHILPFIDYSELQASYDTDMIYAKGILNRLHEAMVSAYGGETLREDSNTADGFVVIPGIVRGSDNGKLALALLELDLSSSGEHWGTSFLCKYGVVAQDGIEAVSNNSSLLKSEVAEIKKTYLPYDYCYTAKIPGDFHVDHRRLPEALKEVLKDFRNHRAELLFEDDELPENTSAELYALGIDMMDSFDFLIKMEAIIPGAGSESLQNIIELAESLDEEGSYTKGDYLRAAFTEYDAAARQYGSDVTRKLLDLSATFIVNPSKISGAAKFLHDGVNPKDIPRMVIDGKCDPPSGNEHMQEGSLGSAPAEKPSVLGKIREAAKAPKESRRDKQKNDRSGPEH